MSGFKSSTGEAEKAVGGFQKIEFSPAKAEVSKSTPISMKNGKKLSSKVYKNVTGLNQKMLELTKAIPAYAQKVEENDLKDSQMITKSLAPSFNGKDPLSIF